MSLLEFVTAENIINDWRGCDEWCSDPVKQQILRDTAGTPPGIRIAVVVAQIGPGSAKDKCWAYFRFAVLGPKVWGLLAEIVDNTSGILNPDSLAVSSMLRAASTGTVPLDFTNTITIMQDARKARPRTNQRANVQTYVPALAATALHEHLRPESDRTSPQAKEVRTSEHLMSILNALAEKEPEGARRDEVYQNVLDKILVYYEEEGLV